MSRQKQTGPIVSFETRPETRFDARPRGYAGWDMDTHPDQRPHELKQPYGVLRATRGEASIFMYNQAMRFNVRPFRRFQWQLSLSYTLVAVGSLLVVELILIAGFLVLLNSDTLPHLLVRTFREQFSVNLRGYLDRPQPDLKGIDRYLSAYIDPNRENNSGDIGLNNGSGQIWTTRDSTQSLIVLDPQGRVLWAQFPQPGASVGDTFDQARIPGLAKVMPAALANDPNENHLYAYEGSLMIMAIPIASEETASAPARVLGVMVFQLSMPSMSNPAFVLQLLPTVLVSALLFTLFAGLVGTLFGFFTARGLTRRLGRVSQAADAWSRGDFSSFIADARDDELSELSQRLNAMAEQLQNLMETRQALATMEERNRIARELHDSVKQQVFAASMQLGAAHALLPDENSPAAQRLTEAEALTRQAQNELTALIRELRPVALESKGLVRALRDLSADWSRQAGIAAQFDGPAGAG